MVMDSLLMMLLHMMNLFVTDFVKYMNLKSISIVVFASNASFVFTFVLWQGGGVWGLKGVLCCYKLLATSYILHENTQFNKVSSGI